MADYPWFKAWNDLPTNPLLRRLEPALRWGWVCILAVASEARTWTEHHGDLLVARNTPATLADLADVASLDIASMSRLCHALCHADMLRIVQRDYGDEVYHVASFAKRNHRKPSDEANATRERKRKSRAALTDHGSEEKSAIGHADVTPQEDRVRYKNTRAQKSPSKSSSRVPLYTPDFDTFWKEYPRRVEKLDAFKTWEARLKDGFTAQQMIDGARRYATECRRNGTVTKYVKHPATFLGPKLSFVPPDKGDEQESLLSHIPLV